MSKRGEGREHVIFLASREAEEEHYEERTQQKDQPGAISRRARWLAQSEQPDTRQRLREETGPWEKPDENETPEKEKRNRAIISRHAVVKIAKKEIVDEIEPEEAPHEIGRAHV